MRMFPQRTGLLVFSPLTLNLGTLLEVTLLVLSVGVMASAQIHAMAIGPPRVASPLGR